MLDEIFSDKNKNLRTLYKTCGILLIFAGAAIPALTAISLYYNHIGRLGFIVSISVGISSILTGCLIAHLSYSSMSLSKPNNSDSPIQ